MRKYKNRFYQPRSVMVNRNCRNFLLLLRRLLPLAIFYETLFIVVKTFVTTGHYFLKKISNFEIIYHGTSHGCFRTLRLMFVNIKIWNYNVQYCNILPCRCAWLFWIAEIFFVKLDNFVTFMIKTLLKFSARILKNSLKFLLCFFCTLVF